MWYNTKISPKAVQDLKRRMQRQRAANRRQLIDIPVESQKEDSMELEKVKEGMVYSSEKKNWEESY